MTNSENSRPIVIHWFRRDLRIHDNTALTNALNSGFLVLPVFIFDSEILSKLDKADKRVSFIHQALQHLNSELIGFGSGIRVFSGTPSTIMEELLNNYTVVAVYTNNDYEPYALKRDDQIRLLLRKNGIDFHSFKDQVIFEKGEVLKDTGDPYTVFTPYGKKWSESCTGLPLFCAPHSDKELHDRFLQLTPESILSLEDIGFEEKKGLFQVPIIKEEIIRDYDKKRDFPYLEGTSRMSVHLRFGTISIRELVSKAIQLNLSWLNELQWREFFMQILWHFPGVVAKPFKPQYERIEWINDENQFQRWCRGETGYPLVDAGMRELNATGFMHNRVRMVTASFLVKHLLIDWRWGEDRFAEKLLDYELSSNNGNWQWVAGTGCDAAPYFRIFNPLIQADKFDPNQAYIKKWVPEIASGKYIKPIVDHASARARCLKAYAAVR